MHWQTLKLIGRDESHLFRLLIGYGQQPPRMSTIVPAQLVAR
jgi:hypothetical protein